MRRIILVILLIVTTVSISGEKICELPELISPQMMESDITISEELG